MQGAEPTATYLLCDVDQLMPRMNARTSDSSHTLLADRKQCGVVQKVDTIYECLPENLTILSAENLTNIVC